MEISFLRHGDAESLAPSDKERKLTQKGRDDIEKIAGSLQVFGEKYEFIFSSPLLRAVETAEIVAKKLGIQDNLIIEERLKAGARFDAVKEIFMENKSSNSILFVGHAPDVEIIAQEFLGLNEQIKFKKGSCLKLEAPFVRTGTGKLLYFINPDLLA